MVVGLESLSGTVVPSAWPKEEGGVTRWSLGPRPPGSIRGHFCTERHRPQGLVGTGNLTGLGGTSNP